MLTFLDIFWHANHCVDSFGKIHLAVALHSCKSGLRFLSSSEVLIFDRLLNQV